MKKKLKFEEAIRRLEEITDQLSDGCSLDEALKLYAEGAELIRPAVSSWTRQAQG